MPDIKLNTGGVDLSVFETQPEPVLNTGDVDLSIFGEQPKKKEQFVFGDSESGDSRSLSSTPDREFLQEPVIAKVEPPTSKEINASSGGNETGKALKSATARAVGGIVGLPSFIEDQIGSFLIKPIAKSFGFSDDEAQAAALAMKQAPILGGITIGNLSQQAQQSSNKYASGIESTMKQYESGILESIYNKDFSDAGAQLWKGAVQSLPYLVMTVATSGGGTPAVLSIIGTTAAAQRYGELTDENSPEGKKLSETGKYANAWMYGGFEAAGELVTAGLANVVKKAAAQIGTEAAEQIGKGFVKEAAKGFLLEGSSEGMTEFGQQMTDYIHGVRDNFDFKAIGDASLVGGVMGVGFAGTTSGMNKTAKIIAGRKVASESDVKKINENNTKIVDLLAEKEKATTPEAQAAIKTQLESVALENDKIIKTNEEKALKLTPEELLKIKDLDSAIDSYNERIDNPSETDNVYLLTEIKDKLVSDKTDIIKESGKTPTKTKPEAVVDLSQIPEVKADQDWAAEQLKKEDLSDFQKTYSTQILDDPRAHYEGILSSRQEDLKSNNPDVVEVAQERIKEAEAVLAKIDALQPKPVVAQAKVEETKPKKEPVVVFHSTYEGFKDFKNGVNYFAEDPEYSKQIASEMNANGKASDFVESRKLNTMPVEINPDRVYELPKGQEMNSKLVDELTKDPSFIEKYDAIKGIDLYSKDKVVYAVLDKSKTKPIEATQEPVEPLSPKKAPIVPPKQKEAKKQQKEVVVEATDFKTELSQLKQEKPNDYWSVDMPSDEVIDKAEKDGRIIETEGGRAIVKEDGDIVGVYSNQTTKGVFGRLIQGIVKLGGNKLDAYDTKKSGSGDLVANYEKNGFRVVARVDFNEAEAPKDMPLNVRASKPDVVVMAYDPSGKMKIKERRFGKDQYAQALSYRDSFLSEETVPDHNKSADTQNFFSDVVTGKSDKYKPKKKWSPILVFSKAQEAVRKVYEKFNGNFDEHIATSIPAFRDVQIKVVSAINKMIGSTGGLVYDIGGSEGGFAKTITSLSGGKVKSINLDANRDMQKVHNANPVSGSTFVKEAFGEGFDYNGVTYKRHTPKKKADIVHESMTFQFIDHKRADKLDEVVDNYLKSDGLFITEEKVHAADKEQFDANEAKKDNDFKSQYYDKDQIDKKKEEVLTGMAKDQTTYERYKNELLKRFDFVEEYWDGGNFKGLVASNDKTKIDLFLKEVGNTDTEFSEKNIKKQPVVSGEQIEVKQLKKEEDAKETSEKGNEKGRQERLLSKTQEADALLADGLSDLADLLGAKLSLTGEQRVKAKDAIKKIAKGLLLKGEVSAEQLFNAIKDYLSKAKYNIDDDIISEALKEEGYATKIRESNKGDLIQEEGLVEGAQRQIPVRNTKSDQEAPRGEDEVKPKVHKPRKGKDGVKIGRFESRLSLEETKLPESVKKRILEEGIGEYDVMPDEEAQQLADAMTNSNDLATIKDLVFSSSVHAAIRAKLMLNVHKIMYAEFNAAEKSGDTKMMDYWSDEQIDFYEKFGQEVSRTSAYLLRGLGTEAALETFAPYTYVRKYKAETNADRKKLQNTDTHKKSLKKVQKAAKKLHTDAVDGAINSPKVKKIIAEAEGTETAVKPDRMKQLKQKEKELIEKLKKSLKGGTLTSGGLNTQTIEALGELAVVYMEELGYNVAKSVKRLINTAKKVGITLTEEEANKLIPTQIEGRDITELQAEEETQKAAEKLAKRIFGEVLGTPAKEDPLAQMVSTLLGKFKERDLGKEKKEAKSDIQKIAEAIKNKEQYAEVWLEAKEKAIASIEANENIDEDQKEEAIKRIEDSYIKATSFTFTEAQIDKAIRRKMASLDIKVREIVKEFFDIQSAERGRLKDALIEEAGLDGKQAELLGKAIEDRFNTIMAEGKQALIDKYVGRVRDAKTKEEKSGVAARKTAVADLLELINIGAFESKEFREAYSTAVGIPVVTAENAKIIKELGEAIRRQKEPLMKHKKTQSLLGFMKLIGGISPSDMMVSVWYANVLGNIKTQERNLVGGSSGVMIRLLSDLLLSGRFGAAFRGSMTGIKSGYTKASDVMKEGYAPFSERIEVPATAEIKQYQSGTGMALLWNNIKYVGRLMNSLDLMNAEIGKEAFANVLANEALNISRFKNTFSSAYRRETKELVDKYLKTDKETVARLKREIEEDAAEFGYTELDKKMILLDKINSLRPIETTEQASRFGVFSTGNVPAYGTLGMISDYIAKALRNMKITFTNKKTGKKYSMAPLSLFAAFTKISGNVGTMSLNLIPGVGLYRVVAGGYGAAFNMGEQDNLLSKYSVELTPREKKTILGMQLAGTVAMSLLYALSDPGDDDDPLIRITANGTGDYTKNKSLEDWHEYAIGVKVGDKRVWIPYKYTPLILPLSVIGFVRDAKQYREKYKEESDILLFGKALGAMPSFLGDMTAIGSMTKVIDDVVNASKEGDTTPMVKSLARTISGFYTPGMYRDVVDIVEQSFNIGVDAPIKGTSLLDIETAKQTFMGRQPISVVKRGMLPKEQRIELVDVYGRTSNRKMFWEEIVKIEKTPSEEDKAILYHQKQMGVPSEPQPKVTKFENFYNDEFTRVLLDQGDPRQRELWHRFVKLRGRGIVDAIQRNMDLSGEEYKDAVSSAIEQATKDAKFEIEMELMEKPIVTEPIKPKQ
jgi:hypothetical protein